MVKYLQLLEQIVLTNSLFFNKCLRTKEPNASLDIFWYFASKVFWVADYEFKVEI